jgi:hypothetical protein
MKKYFLLAVILFVAAISHAFQADFNHDGIVNFADFAVLANEWLQGTSGSVDEYITGADNSDGVIYQNEWRGQTITPTSTYEVTGVKLLLYKHQRLEQTPGTVIVSLRATVSGVPVLPDLCSGAMDGAILMESTTGEYYTITFGEGILLTSGTKYAIIIEAPNATAFEYVVWLRDASSPTYTGGNDVKSFASGVDGSWTSDNTDFLFQVLGE